MDESGRLPVIAPDWPAPAGVRAAVTTRAGGVSEGHHACLNLGTRCGDAQAAVAANRARLCRMLRLPAEPLWLDQRHGNAVVPAHAVSVGPVADASWTDRVGPVCAVLAADCLPVLLCDDAGRCVAAVHAGWRGLAAGVVEAAVAALPVPPRRLLAWLGPAIGPAHFEVGEEVRTTFVAVDAQARLAFRPAAAPGKFYADLWLLARQRLRRAGVSRSFGGGLCTYSDGGRFFSHRRQPGGGRQAALIWLQSVPSG
ncbi:MAG: peptidoglycan editing factor PgeF [Gammaproteobacteria bacterium]|nr:peptidoglycan editing factor PgeF [Gammaproteobacteria bacterium]